MPTQRRRLSSHSTHKRGSSSNPSPEYVIAKLSTKASDNQALVAHFRILCERELAKPRPDRSPYEASRLRQLLMLLTGAEANADLFFNPTDGQPREPYVIYRLAAELVKPYRIEGSSGWLGVQRALKFIRQLCYEFTKDVVVGALDIYLFYLIVNYGLYKPTHAANSLTRMFGSRKAMDASIKTLKTRLSNCNILRFQKSLMAFAVSVTTLIATMVVFGSPHSHKMMSFLTAGH